MSFTIDHLGSALHTAVAEALENVADEIVELSRSETWRTIKPIHASLKHEASRQRDLAARKHALEAFPHI